MVLEPPAAACTSLQGLCESQTPCGLVLLELSCRSGAALAATAPRCTNRARLLRSQTAAAKLCLDRRCAERSRTLPVPVRADWSSAPAGAEHERQTTRYERVTAAGSEAFDLCASAGKPCSRAPADRSLALRGSQPPRVHACAQPEANQTTRFERVAAVQPPRRSGARAEELCSCAPGDRSSALRRSRPPRVHACAQRAGGETEPHASSVWLPPSPPRWRARGSSTRARRGIDLWRCGALEQD